MSATATAVKERPIIFGADSVKAIFEGRKTQTRRVVKNAPAGNFWEPRQFADKTWLFEANLTPSSTHTIGPCPYGKPGDRLWVRETCAPWFDRRPTKIDWKIATQEERRTGKNVWRVHYKASPTYEGEQYDYISPIFMPRWASRITLEITSVRVERVQDITEADAVAEGVRRFTKDGDLMKFWMCDPCDGPLKRAWADLPRTAKEGFQHGWNALNARRGFPWESNPFVWVVEFKKL